jgi:hypothetical protein
MSSTLSFVQLSGRKRIREHTAEAHAGRGHAIDLGERDLRLGTCRSIFSAPFRQGLTARKRNSGKRPQPSQRMVLYRFSTTSGTCSGHRPSGEKKYYLGAIDHSRRHMFSPGWLRRRR